MEYRCAIKLCKRMLFVVKEDRIELLCRCGHLNVWDANTLTSVTVRHEDGTVEEFESDGQGGLTQTRVVQQT